MVEKGATPKPKLEQAFEGLKWIHDSKGLGLRRLEVVDEVARLQGLELEEAQDVEEAIRLQRLELERLKVVDEAARLL